MKKTIIFGLIVILLVSTICAITLNNKEEAIAWLIPRKEQREVDIEKITAEIEYITNKECSIDYDTLEPNCDTNICFNYSYRNINDSECIFVEEKWTIDQIDEEARRTAKERIIKQLYPIPEVKYTDIELIGRKISLELDTSE